MVVPIVVVHRGAAPTVAGLRGFWILKLPDSMLRLLDCLPEKPEKQADDWLLAPEWEIRLGKK